MFLSSVKNILPVLVMVCLASFLLRGLEVWSGVKSLSGEAFAVEKSHEEPPPMPEHPETATESTNADGSLSDKAHGADESGGDGGGAEKNIAAGSDEITLPAAFDNYDISDVQKELVADLLKQRKRLEERETALVQKEALLSAAEQALDRKYQEMLALRTDIEDLLGKQSKEEDERIDSLVKIYEGMKAKEAAGIFNTLDLDILVEVISRMSERKVSPILASMNPERARTVTIMLAEQKKLPELPAQ